MDDRLKRHDLTEDEWVRLLPLLPAHPRRGHRWADHRMVINGVFFRARAACPWRSLPPVYGSWKTVYNRHRRWSTDGTWEAVLSALRTAPEGVEGRVFGARSITGAPRRRARPEDIRPGRMFEVANW